MGECGTSLTTNCGCWCQAPSSHTPHSSSTTNVGLCRCALISPHSSSTTNVVWPHINPPPLVYKETFFRGVVPGRIGSCPLRLSPPSVIRCRVPRPIFHLDDESRSPLVYDKTFCRGAVPCMNISRSVLRHPPSRPSRLASPSLVVEDKRSGLAIAGCQRSAVE
jgi:hypothetical protein